MQLVDTHAHIYLPAFDADREEMLKRAAENDVGYIVMPAIDAATHEQMLAVSAQWSQCYAMMGLHPCSVTEQYNKELSVVEVHLKQQKFKAIGEIGLDFYWDTTFKAQQYSVFEMQLQWALEHHLPVVIHSRNALDACIEVVQNYPAIRGVFHCFSGTIEQAKRLIDLRFFLGIGGVLTYKKSGLDRVIAAVGLDAVVLETDAPYLTPVPYRGKRNECSYLSFIAQKLAEVTVQSIEDVATITTQNAKRLFNLP